MATNEVGAQTLRVVPRGELPAESSSRRPGGARAASTPLQAYVLHRWDWSESSLIVDLFTRERGRLVVVAKGAKKPTSNFRAVLLPFCPLLALPGKAPAEGAGEVHTLRSAEWAGGQPLLPAAQLFSGFYLNELLMKLLAREDAHAALFDCYAQALASLAAPPAGTDEAAVLRAFELVLLRETGVLPALDGDAQTAEPLDPSRRYTLHAQSGLAAAPEGPAGRHWLAIEVALAQADWLALLQACQQAGAALRAPLREALHYHLGPVPLATRQVWQGVQKLAGRTAPHEPTDRR
jgi:DNA repair protein RecO (recombination protein O)